MSYIGGPRLTVTMRISADVRHILLIGMQDQDELHQMVEERFPCCIGEVMYMYYS